MLMAGIEKYGFRRLAFKETSEFPDLVNIFCSASMPKREKISMAMRRVFTPLAQIGAPMTAPGNRATDFRNPRLTRRRDAIIDMCLDRGAEMRALWIKGRKERAVAPRDDWASVAWQITSSIRRKSHARRSRALRPIHLAWGEINDVAPG